MQLELKLYSKQNCHLCDDAKNELELVKEEIDVVICEVDIYQDDELLELYGLMIPVVAYKEEIIQYGKIDFLSILSFLKSKT